jgi:hypothetical protein
VRPAATAGFCGAGDVVTTGGVVDWLLRFVSVEEQLSSLFVEPPVMLNG